MAGIRRTDTDSGWIQRRFRDLERRLNEQAAAKRLAGTEVPEGSSFFVRGILAIVGLLDVRGTVSMKSEDGNELVRLGDTTFGRGVEMQRDDGTDAFVLRKPFSPTDQQVWALLDKTEATIVGEDPLTGGLYRPHLEHPFQPVATASGTAVVCGPYGLERSTSSASFTTLFVHDGKRQNSRIDLKVAVKCSDGATAGEVQVVDLGTGSPLPGLFVPSWLGVIPAGTTTLTILDPSEGETALTGFSVGAAMRLGIQVRRTAGTGSITLSVVQAIGG